LARDDPVAVELIWGQYHRISFRPLFLADHAAYLRALYENSNMVQRPYSPTDRNEQVDGHHQLTNMLLPATYRIKEIHLETIAQVRMTLAGLALLQYRQDQGAFPPSLDALDIKGLADPFVDQPLQYRPEPEGFVLYSVGKDQKDNNGSPQPPRPKRKENFDLVWQFSGSR